MKRQFSPRSAITTIVIVLIFLGIGYFLFKVSPQQTSTVGYNSSLDASAAGQISAPPPFDPQTDHFLGSPTAKNVFIEYGDLQCPACAAFNATAKQIPARVPNTVYVFRYYPLVQIHQNAVEAALAAESAGAQGKYWEMFDLLFSKQPDWENLSDPLNAFAGYAQQAGVANLDVFRQDLVSKKNLAAIEKDNNEAIGLSLQGTPSLFIGGHEIQPSDIQGLLKQAQPYLNK